jgi:hypothetical protein
MGRVCLRNPCSFLGATLRMTLCVFEQWVMWEQLGSRTSRISPNGGIAKSQKSKAATGLKSSWFTLRSNRSGVRISPGAPAFNDLQAFPE